MRGIGNILVAVALSLTVSGCVESPSEVPVPIDQAAPEASEASPLPTPTSTPTPTESEPEVIPEQCSGEVEAGMQQTIGSQTQAFAEGEFELAYSLASPNFQNSVNLRSFVAIIAGSYGPLIESSALGYSDCLMDPGQSFGVIDVSFIQGGDDVYALRYLLVDTPDGWRVEGASNLEVIGKGA